MMRPSRVVPAIPAVKSRRFSANKLQGTTETESTHVCVRVRPLEDDLLETPAWKHDDVTIENVSLLPGMREGTQMRYTYDRIFGSDVSTQTVYEQSVRDVVGSTLDGFNATIFAYGQTGSGKTYTLFGTDGDAGIVPRALADIFETLARVGDREHIVRLSVVEVYNEVLIDLLSKQERALAMRETAGGALYVAGLTEQRINTFLDALALLHEAMSARRIGATSANERSSRAHTIVRLVVESRSIVDASHVTVSQLNMVDLAGTERVAKTQATGRRLAEGQAINRSLTSLGLVVRKLAKISRGEGVHHVPFRDSKLTRLLQNSLGGNARVVFLACINPGEMEVIENNGTLQFADQAKAIKTKPLVNILPTPKPPPTVMTSPAASGRRRRDSFLPEGEVIASHAAAVTAAETAKVDGGMRRSASQLWGVLAAKIATVTAFYVPDPAQEEVLEVAVTVANEMGIIDEGEEEAAQETGQISSNVSVLLSSDLGATSRTSANRVEAKTTIALSGTGAITREEEAVALAPATTTTVAAAAAVAASTASSMPSGDGNGGGGGGGGGDADVNIGKDAVRSGAVPNNNAAAATSALPYAASTDGTATQSRPSPVPSQMTSSLPSYAGRGSSVRRPGPSRFTEAAVPATPKPPKTRDARPARYDYPNAGFCERNSLFIALVVACTIIAAVSLGLAFGQG
eukprot:UC1_evm1s1864